MPTLFYGCAHNYGLKGRKLYTDGLREIETSVFDSFLIDGLAPYKRPHAVANIWHLRKKKHTAISWHEDQLKHEQSIFLPGFLDQREALELARTIFTTLIPSPIIFRFRQDYYDVLLFD